MVVPLPMLLPEDETAWVDAARRGEAAARDRLYRRHRPRLWRHARLLLHDPADAEDLVQDAFAAAFASLWRFRGESSFATWLHHIAINLARHRWRSATRRRALLRAYAWFAPGRDGDRGDPQEAVGADQELGVVQRAIEALSPRLREAFVLLVVEGLPGEEASRLTGVRSGALRVRATRARQKIQAALAAAAGEES